MLDWGGLRLRRHLLQNERPAEIGWACLCVFADRLGEPGAYCHQFGRCLERLHAAPPASEPRPRKERRAPWGPAAALEALRRFADAEGRTPGFRELRSRLDLPRPSTLERLFGTVRAAMEQAGLEPRHVGVTIGMLQTPLAGGSAYVARSSRVQILGAQHGLVMCMRCELAWQGPMLEAMDAFEAHRQECQA